MIQTGIEAVKQITPNTAVIILLALFVAEKVISMTFKGVALLRGHVNGKESEKKDETQRLPCLLNPVWSAHTQETHDAKLIGERVESGMRSLLLESTKQTLESKAQTGEIKKQTRVLEKIRDNGSKK